MNNTIRFLRMYSTNSFLRVADSEIINKNYIIKAGIYNMKVRKPSVEVSFESDIYSEIVYQRGRDSWVYACTEDSIGFEAVKQLIESTSMEEPIQEPIQDPPTHIIPKSLPVKERLVEPIQDPPTQIIPKKLVYKPYTYQK